MALVKLNATLGLTGTLPAVSGANLTNVSAGKVLQSVTATHVGGTATNSNSFVGTGLTLNITPSATSSKIYVISSSSIDNNSSSGDQADVTIYRDSTNLGGTGGIVNTFGTDTRILVPCTVCVLDSPNSTSQIAYTVRIRSRSGATMTINSQSEEGQIIAMEIAG